MRIAPLALSALASSALIHTPLPLAADPLAETLTPGARAEAPADWLGAEPHFLLMGTVGGYRFAVDLDAAALSGVEEFEGKREYLAVAEGFRYIDFEVALKIVLDGIEKAIELEFENHDFAAHALPADFALQGAEFPEGLLSTLELQFEWEHAGTSVNEEIGGWEGVLRLALDEGTADGKGLRPDGRIGGFVSARRGDDAVVISFTVPVAEYEIED